MRYIVSFSESMGVAQVNICPPPIKALRTLLADSERWGRMFFAVHHPQWGDGYHPPHPALIGGVAASEMEFVRVLSAADKLPALFKPSEFASSIDVSIFVEAKGSNHDSDFVAGLKDAFLKGEVKALIKRYGGMWVYCHDGITLHLDVLRDDPVLSDFAKSFSRETADNLCQYLHGGDVSLAAGVFLEFDPRSQTPAWRQVTENMFRQKKRAFLTA